MIFFRLILGLVIFNLIACAPEYNTDPMAEGASFSIGQVTHSRTEWTKNDESGMPEEVMIEMKSKIMDTGLRIQVPNEKFEITTNGQTTTAITDFDGILLWKTNIPLDGAGINQDINLKISIKPLLRHQGVENISIVVRPWLNRQSRVVDPRYQKVERISEQFKNSKDGFEMIIADGDLHFRGDKARVDNRMTLHLTRQYQLSARPQYVQPLTLNELPRAQDILQGKFQVTSYVFAMPEASSEPAEVAEHLLTCGARCLQDVQTKKLEIRNGSLNFNINFHHSHNQMHALRLRSVLVLHVRVDNPDINDFFGFAIWAPTLKENDLEFQYFPSETVAQNIAQIKFSPQLPPSPLVATNATKKLRKALNMTFPDICGDESVMEMGSLENCTENDMLANGPAEEVLQENFLKKWDLNDKKLNALLEKRESVIKEFWNNKECETSTLWGMAEYFMTVVLGRDRTLPACTEQVDKKELKISYVSLILEVLNSKSRPIISAAPFLQLHDTVFREIRNDKNINYGSTGFTKAFVEGKVGTPSGLMISGAAISQTGVDYFQTVSTGFGGNQRSRNAGVEIHQFQTERRPFLLNVKAINCLNAVDPDTLYTYSYCDESKVVSQEVVEEWVYVFRYYKPSAHTYLTDPENGRHSEVGFTFRGRNQYELFRSIINDDLGDFALVPSIDQPTWTDLGRSVDEHLSLEGFTETHPAVYFHSQDRTYN